MDNKQIEDPRDYLRSMLRDNMVERYNLTPRSEVHNRNAALEYEGKIGDHDVQLAFFDGIGGEWVHLSIAFGGAHHLDWPNRTPLGTLGIVEGSIHPGEGGRFQLIAPMSRLLICERLSDKSADPIAFCLGLSDYLQVTEVPQEMQRSKKGTPHHLLNQDGSEPTILPGW